MAATHPELAAFIEHARARGMDHATIRLLLLSAGWKERDVVHGLAETTLELPVPLPPDSGGARDAFFHLLTFAAFYTTVVGVLMLLFRYIDRLFPDPALEQYDQTMDWELQAIRWGLALVIVSFPAFLWLSRLLLRDLRDHPEKAAGGVRRWLTYLTLVAAALAMGCDVIALVFHMLEGELSTRFLLKVLAVLVVAGLSFAYYLQSLRRPVVAATTRRMHRAFAGLAGALVLLTVGQGFALIGSPGTERLRRIDERRIRDLKAIQDEIEVIVLGERRHRPIEERTLERPLPATLEEVVAAARRQRPDTHDPETGESYGYEVLDERRFHLCATFRFERDERQEVRWNHPAGRHCFELDALAAD